MNYSNWEVKNKSNSRFQFVVLDKLEFVEAISCYGLKTVLSGECIRKRILL